MVKASNKMLNANRAPVGGAVDFDPDERSWGSTSPALLRWMLQQMILIRRFEEALLELKNQDLINGPVHTSVGQEAIAVGVATALRPEDWITGSHRAHHQYLAKVLSACAPPEFDPLNKRLTRRMREEIRVLLCEVMGLADGCSGGRGGSMHLYRPGPGGRFWAGTCAKTCDVSGAGSLYCLGTDLKVHRMLDNLTVANGLTWSPDRKTMYCIDTPTFEIRAFDYDIDSGEIRDRRVAVAVPEEEGYPDGMTCDAEGMLWVAHWEGSRVCRWNPGTGSKIGEVRFPVELVSCCTFGGEKLDTLYVTTSRLGLKDEALRRQPLAGSLFRVNPGVPGTPTYLFEG